MAEGREATPFLPKAPKRGKEAPVDISSIAKDELNKLSDLAQDLVEDVKYSDLFSYEALKSQNQAQFNDLIKSFVGSKKIDSLPLSSVVLTAERLLFQPQQDGPEKHQIAVNKYTNIIAVVKTMKEKREPIGKVFTYLLSFQGEYDEGSSTVTSLLADGKGNCEARAKLMAMAVQDVYGQSMPVAFQVMNVKSPKDEKAVPHIRTIADYKGKKYVLEIPEAKTISAKETSSADIYEPRVFTESYARKQGILPPLSSTQNDAIAEGKTDSIFALPTSEKIYQTTDSLTTSYSTVIQKRLDDMARKAGWKTPEPQAGEVAEAEKYKFNFSYVTNLEDPALAQYLVDTANKGLKNNEMNRSVDLGGITSITPECAEIISHFRTTHLYLGGSKGLKITPDVIRALIKRRSYTFLYLTAKGDLKADVAEVISRQGLYYLYLHLVDGGLTAESTKALFKKPADLPPNKWVGFFEGLTIHSDKPYPASVGPELNGFKNATTTKLELDSDYPMDDQFIEQALHNSPNQGDFVLNLGRPITESIVNFMNTVTTQHSTTVIVRGTDFKITKYTSKSDFEGRCEFKFYEPLDAQKIALVNRIKGKSNYTEIVLEKGVSADSADALAKLNYEEIRLLYQANSTLPPEFVAKISSVFPYTRYRKASPEYGEHYDSCLFSKSPYRY